MLCFEELAFNYRDIQSEIDMRVRSDDDWQIVDASKSLSCLEEKNLNNLLVQEMN